MSAVGVIAQVAVTFLGFTGVVFAVKTGAFDSWDDKERNALVHLLAPTIIVLFLAFVPMLTSLATTDEEIVWRIANAVLFVVHAPLVSRVLWLSITSRLVEPLPMRVIGLPIGFSTIAGNLVVALGFGAQFAPFAFTIGLVWLLVIATIQFVMLVTPKGKPPRPCPK